MWRKLQEIEYGQLKTYGDLANLVGEERNKPNMSAQAIGGAVGSIRFLLLFHAIAWLEKMEV